MGDVEVFPAIMNSTFSSAKTAFEISLGLTGVLSLWLGIMRIGEKGGVVNVATFSQANYRYFSNAKLFRKLKIATPVKKEKFNNEKY